MNGLISKENFDNIVTALEWALEEIDFECNCEPHYERDTNATIHSDNCNSHMPDHFEITLKELKAAWEKDRPVVVCLCGSEA